MANNINVEMDIAMEIAGRVDGGQRLIPLLSPAASVCGDAVVGGAEAVVPAVLLKRSDAKEVLRTWRKGNKNLEGSTHSEKLQKAGKGPEQSNMVSGSMLRGKSV